MSRKYACESDEIAARLAELAKERAAVLACSCERDETESGELKLVCPPEGCLVHGGRLPTIEASGWRKALGVDGVSRRAIRYAAMTFPAPFFAAAIVLAAAAAGTGDFELVVPPLANEPTICTKDLPSDAISAGRWPIAPRETVTSCRVHDGCFDERSNWIPGFNLPAGLR